MTVPTVRKRIKRPKTRTGCRTCRTRRIKCDEEYPACRNCVKSGRNCDGYDHVASKPAKSATAVVSTRKANIVRSPTAFTISLTPAAIQALDFFRLNTIDQLPGSSSNQQWENIALRMARHEPAIAHILVALGSLHRAITSDYSPVSSGSLITVDSTQHDYALTHSTKALALLRTQIEKSTSSGERCSDSQIEVILLMALLCFCFEVFHGQDQRATLHLRTGLNILYDRMRDRSEEKDDEKRVILMRTKPRDTLDLLVQTFFRLDADSLNREGETDLVPICNERMPQAFFTLEEANTHLDVLVARIEEVLNKLADAAGDDLSELIDFDEFDEQSADILCMAAGRTVDLTDAPELIEKLEKTRDDMRSWMSAFASIPVTSTNEQEHRLTRIFCFEAWLSIETCRDETEMMVDRFEEQSGYIVDVIEEYIEASQSTTAIKYSAIEDGSIGRLTRHSLPPGFAYGTGIVSCICLIIAKMRNSALRRRCMKLLDTINFHGVFDGAYLAAYMQTVIDLEEEGASELIEKPDKTELECQEIPEEVRILQVDMMPQALREGERFYKSETGNLIYVVLTDEDECGFRVEKKPFAVRRS